MNETEARRWTEEAMRIYAELDEQKIENMNKCRQIRERLPEIYESAKNAGINVKALKAAVKVARAKMAFENAIEAATPEDDEDVAAFEYLRAIAVPGDLFEAATRSHSNDEGDDDLRPNFLKNQEAARENTSRLKKGIKGLPGADAVEA